jgi:hypothetical protein
MAYGCYAAAIKVLARKTRKKDPENVLAERLIYAVIYREWVENLGSRQALPRLANLLCDLPAGWRWSGCWTATVSASPVTQQDFVDACGLATAHADRTIQELRRRGLVESQGPIVRLLQRKKLEMVADFSPATFIR